MTCMKQEFCIHEKYCQRHIGQNFDSCILFSRNSKPMTNEEYLRSCTTEQLAEWMALRLNQGILLALRMKYHCDGVDAVREWLKEKHD